MAADQIVSAELHQDVCKTGRTFREWPDHLPQFTGAGQCNDTISDQDEIGARRLTHRIEITPEGVLEVEYFGSTTYTDRTTAIDALDIDTGPGTKRILVNFIRADLIAENDGSRLEFIAKAITDPRLRDCRVALVGVDHSFAHPAETALTIRGVKVRTFDDRASALVWLVQA